MEGQSSSTGVVSAVSSSLLPPSKPIHRNTPSWNRATNQRQPPSSLSYSSDNVTNRAKSRIGQQQNDDRTHVQGVHPIGHHQLSRSQSAMINQSFEDPRALESGRFDSTERDGGFHHGSSSAITAISPPNDSVLYSRPMQQHVRQVPFASIGGEGELPAGLVVPDSARDILHVRRDVLPSLLRLSSTQLMNAALEEYDRQVDKSKHSVPRAAFLFEIIVVYSKFGVGNYALPDCLVVPDSARDLLATGRVRYSLLTLPSVELMNAALEEYDREVDKSRHHYARAKFLICVIGGYSKFGVGEYELPEGLVVPNSARDLLTKCDVRHSLLALPSVEIMNAALYYYDLRVNRSNSDKSNHPLSRAKFLVDVIGGYSKFGVDLPSDVLIPESVKDALSLVMRNDILSAQLPINQLNALLASFDGAYRRGKIHQSLPLSVQERFLNGILVTFKRYRDVRLSPSVLQAISDEIFDTGLCPVVDIESLDYCVALKLKRMNESDALEAIRSFRRHYEQVDMCSFIRSFGVYLSDYHRWDDNIDRDHGRDAPVRGDYVLDNVDHDGGRDGSVRYGYRQDDADGGRGHSSIRRDYRWGDDTGRNRGRDWRDRSQSAQYQSKDIDRRDDSRSPPPFLDEQQQVQDPVTSSPAGSDNLYRRQHRDTGVRGLSNLPAWMTKERSPSQLAAAIGQASSALEVEGPATKQRRVEGMSSVVNGQAVSQTSIAAPSILGAISGHDVPISDPGSDDITMEDADSESAVVVAATSESSNPAPDIDVNVQRDVDALAKELQHLTDASDGGRDWEHVSSLSDETAKAMLWSQPSAAVSAWSSAVYSCRQTDGRSVLLSVAGSMLSKAKKGGDRGHMKAFRKAILPLLLHISNEDISLAAKVQSFASKMKDMSVFSSKFVNKEVLPAVAKLVQRERNRLAQIEACRREEARKQRLAEELRKLQAKKARIQKRIDEQTAKQKAPMTGEAASHEAVQDGGAEVEKAMEMERDDGGEEKTIVDERDESDNEAREGHRRMEAREERASASAAEKEKEPKAKPPKNVARKKRKKQRTAKEEVVEQKERIGVTLSRISYSGNSFEDAAEDVIRLYDTSKQADDNDAMEEWLCALKSGKETRILCIFLVISSTLQLAKARQRRDLLQAILNILPEALEAMCERDVDLSSTLHRILEQWRRMNIYSDEVIDRLSADVLEPSKGAAPALDAAAEVYILACELTSLIDGDRALLRSSVPYVLSRLEELTEKGLVDSGIMKKTRIPIPLHGIRDQLAKDAVAHDLHSRAHALVKKWKAPYRRQQKAVQEAEKKRAAKQKKRPPRKGKKPATAEKSPYSEALDEQTDGLYDDPSKCKPALSTDEIPVRPVPEVPYEEPDVSIPEELLEGISEERVERIKAIIAYIIAHDDFKTNRRRGKSIFLRIRLFVTLNLLSDNELVAWSTLIEVGLSSEEDLGQKLKLAKENCVWYYEDGRFKNAEGKGVKVSFLRPGIYYAFGVDDDDDDVVAHTGGKFKGQTRFDEYAKIKARAVKRLIDKNGKHPAKVIFCCMAQLPFLSKPKGDEFPDLRNRIIEAVETVALMILRDAIPEDESYGDVRTMSAEDMREHGAWLGKTYGGLFNWVPRKTYTNKGKQRALKPNETGERQLFLDFFDPSQGAKFVVYVSYNRGKNKKGPMEGTLKWKKSEMKLRSGEVGIYHSLEAKVEGKLFRVASDEIIKYITPDGEMVLGYERDVEEYFPIPTTWVVVHNAFDMDEYVDEGWDDVIHDMFVDECASSGCGETKKVHVMSTSPDGKIYANFKTVYGAKACVKKLCRFNQRNVEVELIGYKDLPLSLRFLDSV